MDGID